jgi:hypothetical protein
MFREKRRGPCEAGLSKKGSIQEDSPPEEALKYPMPGLS